MEQRISEPLKTARRVGADHLDQPYRHPARDRPAGQATARAAKPRLPRIATETRTVDMSANRFKQVVGDFSAV